MTAATQGDGRLNVLLVVPLDAKRGGVVSVVDNLANHLQASGHRASFFPSGPSRIVEDRTTALRSLRRQAPVRGWANPLPMRRGVVGKGLAWVA